MVCADDSGVFECVFVGQDRHVDRPHRNRRGHVLEPEALAEVRADLVGRGARLAVVYEHTNPRRAAAGTPAWPARPWPIGRSPNARLPGSRPRTCTRPAAAGALLRRGRRSGREPHTHPQSSARRLRPRLLHCSAGAGLPGVRAGHRASPRRPGRPIRGCSGAPPLWGIGQTAPSTWSTGTLTCSSLASRSFRGEARRPGEIDEHCADHHPRGAARDLTLHFRPLSRVVG